MVLPSSSPSSMSLPSGFSPPMNAPHRKNRTDTVLTANTMKTSLSSSPSSLASPRHDSRGLTMNHQQDNMIMVVGGTQDYKRNRISENYNSKSHNVSPPVFCPTLNFAHLPIVWPIAATLLSAFHKRNYHYILMLLKVY